jgi:hypothetical protein
MKDFGFDKMIWYVNVVVFAICLLLFSHTLAQSGGDYEISWSTIDGGGGTSSGGDYVLTCTIGQPDAAAVSGGKYELLGGFLPGGPLCFVNFEHYARFAEHWLDEPCNESNNWCDGADLYEDEYNIVDGLDLQFFVDQWLCYCPVGWPLK